MQRTEERGISLQTYLELLQCAKNKEQQTVMRDFIRSFHIQVFPLTENIGHRASIYIEQFSLSNGLRAGDAVIAATAVENGLALSSSNIKHFKMIPDLSLKVFKP